MSKKKKAEDLELLENFQETQFEGSFSEPMSLPEAYIPVLEKVENILNKATKTVIKSPQTRAKVEPNRSQSRAKVRTKVEPKWSQSKTPKVGTEAKLEPQPEPHLEPKWSQTEAKVEPEVVFEELTGLQKNTLGFLFLRCKFQGSKNTGPIAITNVANDLKSTPPAVKKALQRIEQKGFIERKSFKNGRGGWTKYELPEGIYRELLFKESRAKVEPNRSQTGAKVGTELEPQPEPRPLSSSSSLLNITTTTNELALLENDKPHLSPAWKQLDLSPLLKIGFKESHLIQIAKVGHLTPEQVQESINAFAWDLQQNNKGKDIQGNPLNFFMGILRKGPYAAPHNYESESDRLFREYREAQEKIQKRREGHLKATQEHEFHEWLTTLTDEEKVKYAPMKGGEHMVRAQHWNYFLEKVWPRKEKEIKDSISNSAIEGTHA